MGATVFSQVWKVSDVYRLRGDLGDAGIQTLRRSAPWSMRQSALFVDSVVNGFPLAPLVVQTCRDSSGHSRLRLLDGVHRVRALVDFADDQLRLPERFVFYGDSRVSAGGMLLSQVREAYPHVARRFDTGLLPVAYVDGDEDMMCAILARLHGVA